VTESLLKWSGNLVIRRWSGKQATRKRPVAGWGFVAADPVAHLLDVRTRWRSWLSGGYCGIQKERCCRYRGWALRPVPTTRNPCFRLSPTVLAVREKRGRMGTTALRRTVQWERSGLQRAIDRLFEGFR
ncbi:hypothetical protein MPH_03092, partial [Macrophomina phaseolina MS6]